MVHFGLPDPFPSCLPPPPLLHVVMMLSFVFSLFSFSHALFFFCALLSLRPVENMLVQSMLHSHSGPPHSVPQPVLGFKLKIRAKKRDRRLF